MNPGVKTIAAAAIVAVGVLGGCQGERMTMGDRPTPEGRWTVGGMLVRSYDVNVAQAYGAIEKLVEARGWTITARATDATTAQLTALTPQAITVEFKVWAPRGRATEIGIEYAGGDRAASARIFEQLEELLPGKRITANQPL